MLEIRWSSTQVNRVVGRVTDVEQVVKSTVRSDDANIAYTNALIEVFLWEIVVRLWNEERISMALR